MSLDTKDDVPGSNSTPPVKVIWDMKHLTKALPSETVSNNTTGTDKSDWPSLDEDVPKLVQTESTRLHSQQVKAEDENTDAPTSVSIPDPPPALEPSSRRKSVKGKPKWIPLPLPDLPPLQSRKGRAQHPKKGPGKSSSTKEPGSSNGVENTNGHESRMKGNRGPGSKPWSKDEKKAFSGKSLKFKRITQETNLASPTVSNGEYGFEFGLLSPSLSPVEFLMPYFPPNGGDFYQSPGVMNDTVLEGMLKNQIEYYFSEENLCRDFYLRRKMDSEGYLPIHLIASFQRVQQLTQDFQKVLNAVESSSKLEMKDGCVRTLVDPLRWPIADSAPGSPLTLVAPTTFPLPMPCAL